MHWPPIPRNMHPMCGPSAEYRPSFNISGLPQYSNYNSNSSVDSKQYFQSATSNSQCNNMHSRIPFGVPPRFNPTFPSFLMNYPQPPNASFSYNVPYPSGRPIRTNTPWSSLPPPPPPPSTDSTIDN